MKAVKHCSAVFLFVAPTELCQANKKKLHEKICARYICCCYSTAVKPTVELNKARKWCVREKNV